MSAEGVDLIEAELDRYFDVTWNQTKAPKTERPKSTISDHIRDTDNFHESHEHTTTSCKSW